MHDCKSVCLSVSAFACKGGFTIRLSACFFSRLYALFAFFLCLHACLFVCLHACLLVCLFFNKQNDSTARVTTSRHYVCKIDYIWYFKCFQRDTFNSARVVAPSEVDGHQWRGRWQALHGVAISWKALFLSPLRLQTLQCDPNSWRSDASPVTEAMKADGN